MICFPFAPPTLSLPHQKRKKGNNMESNFSSTNTDIVMLIVQLHRDLFQPNLSSHKGICRYGNASCMRYTYAYHTAVFSEILLPPWGIATEYHQPKVGEFGCFPGSGNLLSSSAHFPRPLIYSSFFSPQAFTFTKYGNKPAFFVKQFLLMPVNNP